MRWKRGAAAPEKDSRGGPSPRCVHGVSKHGQYCKQCPGKGICKHGQWRTRCEPCARASGTGRLASHLCVHGHQKYACRRGDCPARRLNASAGKGYYTDEEIVAALMAAPPRGLRLRACGGRLVRWPMGLPAGEAARRAMLARDSVRACDWPHAHRAEDGQELVGGV